MPICALQVLAFDLQLVDKVCFSFALLELSLLRFQYSVKIYFLLVQSSKLQSSLLETDVVKCEVWVLFVDLHFQKMSGLSLYYNNSLFSSTQQLINWTDRLINQRLDVINISDIKALRSDYERMRYQSLRTE